MSDRQQQLSGGEVVRGSFCSYVASISMYDVLDIEIGIRNAVWPIWH